MQIARLLAIAALAGTVSLTGSPSPLEAQEIRVLHYGGSAGKAMRETFFDLAEKDMNIKVIDSSRTDMAKIKAMVESGKLEYDVVNVNTLEVGRGARENLWDPIDWSVVDPKVAGPVGKLEFGVPFIGFSIGLAYSTKNYPDPAAAPKTWADFWDVEKFPGPRALENRVRYQLEFALLADGVEEDKLYPLDVERAFRKLDEIKPHITVWAKPPVQTVQLIADGEVVMAPTFNNEVANARGRGVEIELLWQGSLYLTNAWTIVKGTPNSQLANQFINQISEASYQAKFAELTYFGPMNPDALSLIGEKTRKYLPTEPANLEQCVRFDNDWWAANEAALIERWNKWLLN